MSTGWQNDPSVQTWLHTAEPHPDQPTEWNDEPTPAEQDITAPIDDVEPLDDNHYSYAAHEDPQVVEFEDVEDDPYVETVYPTPTVARSTPPPAPPARGQRRWLLIVGASVGVIVVAVLVIVFSIKAHHRSGRRHGHPRPVLRCSGMPLDHRRVHHHRPRPG